MPRCMLGISTESRKFSQLAFESWTATMVQPSGDGPAAW